MKWITRERPKLDRVACPWLISRFIDQDAEFIFVASTEVKQKAAELNATAYDVPGVELTHDGPLCSFDAFIKKYELKDPALTAIAQIVRGADTAQLQLAPQSAGLLAISLGMSRLYADDHDMLEHGFVLYDALLAWYREARDEKHNWNPQREATWRISL